MNALPARRVTTLCFHGIGEPGRPLEPGEERFWISPEQFRSILDAVVAFPEPVEITFDDSNESDHRFGLPELAARRLTAAFFVIAGRLDHEGSLSQRQLVELHDVGMGVGNHGLHHRPWRDLDDQTELDQEIGDAGKLIGEVIGAPVVHAACPRGSYDRQSLRTLKRFGYERVYTVDEGTSQASAWLRNRYTVIHSDTADSIGRRLQDPDGSAFSRLDRAARQLVKRWR